MKMLKSVNTIILFGLLISACSGGSGGTGAGGTANDVSQGEVTKLGSVFVNGVEFETTSASIARDGIMVAESQVLGMPVEVKGDISADTGTALTVVAETAVKGRIDTMPTASTPFVVMGQTIRLDDSAIIETLGAAGTLADLAVGDHVEVAGMAKPGGIIIATRLEEKSALAEYKVKGYIEPASINTTLKTFNIGGLTIDYNSADLSDLPGGPQPNVLVEAKSSAEPLLAIMLANKVEAEGLSVANAVEAEVEGYVRDLSATTPYVFFINGQEVHTDGATVFEGATADYLAENIKVEVEGTLSSGILNASKVSLKDSVRMEGDIISLGTDTFQLKGMPSITITVNASTEFNSKSNNLFSDFKENMHVRLRGLPDTSGNVTATRLDERSADADAYLRGPVDSVIDDVVTVMGIDITVTSLTFENQDGVGISKTEFLDAALAGMPVKIQGTLAGSTITWLSAELED